MPLDLPPPPEPSPRPLMDIRQGAATHVVHFQRYRIHIYGDLKIPVDTLSRAVSQADTVSNAVRRIGLAFRAQHEPLPSVHYALVGQDLYVHVTAGRVSGTAVPEPLTAYFDDLPNDRPLRDSDLEPARALASVHADRAGLHAASQFGEADDGYTLGVQFLEEAEDRARVQFALGNPGNRFVGRHFAEFDITKGTEEGDELRVFWRQAVKDLNEAGRPGRDYAEQHGAWSRVTPWGIFGAGGRYVRFDQRFSGVEFDASLFQGELTWSTIAYADFKQRLSVQLKIDRTLKETELSTDGTDIQREPYDSVEGVAAWARSGYWLSQQRFDLETGLSVRHGVNDFSTPVTQAELDYLLYRPNLRLASTVSGQWRLQWQASGQITDNRLPEQQQWVLGGVGNLHAWLPGVAVGDSGWLSRLELRSPDWTSGDGRLRLRAFAEAGSSRLENRNTTNPTIQLADAGLALEWHYQDWAELHLAAAAPLSDSGIDTATLNELEADFYFRIALRY